MKEMKTFFAKYRYPVLALLLVAAALLVLTALDSGETGPAASPVLAEPVNQYEGIIRLHIIANSDSPEDQELKLKVRNMVLSRVQNHLADCFAKEMVRSGKEELDSAVRTEITRTYIEENLEQIRIWSKDALKAEGADCQVEAHLGVTWIPEKEYDGIHFPAGNYEALNITIGQGQGQNWWCVIFPPLCLVDCGEEIYQKRLETACGGRIVLKSRVLEILKKNNT